ncbi:MAG: hypothetical protein RSB55_05640 [Oscillospiraceae bacterium]
MKRSRSKPLAIFSLLLAAVLFTVSTFAWLTKEQLSDQVYTVLSDFDVNGVLTFGTAEEYTGSSLLVPVSLRPGDSNYIGKMKYVVRYQGVSPAAIRVRILEQWTDITTGDLISANYLNYHVTGGATELAGLTGDSLPAAGQDGTGTPSTALSSTGQWVDRRSTDFCYYYSIPVQPHKVYVTHGTGTAAQDVTAVSQGSVELSFLDQTVSGSGTEEMIRGLNADTTRLELLFEVEAVQPNRIFEFFGIEALPLPPAAKP